MKNLLFLLFSLFIINSCGEASGDLENLNIPLVIGAGGNATGNSKIIKTVSSANNTFFYTVQNSKLTKYYDTNNTTEYNLSYNAGGKIASANGFYNTGNATAASVFNLNFTYDSNGLLSGLSGTETTANVIYNIATTFTYNNGVFIKTYTEKTTQTPLGLSKIAITTDFTYSGANMNKSTMQQTETLNGTSIGSNQTITKFSNFDGSKNYLKGLPKDFALFTTYINADQNYLSTNNYLKKETEVNGGGSTVQDFTLVYDTDNYPIQATTGSSATSFIYQQF